MSKQRLIQLGWTETKLLERISGCRAGIKEINQSSSSWTYRYLFVRLYLGYKHDLKTLRASADNPIDSKQSIVYVVTIN